MYIIYLPAVRRYAERGEPTQAYIYGYGYVYKHIGLRVNLG